MENGQALYGSGVDVLFLEEGKTVYSIRGDDGEGRIVNYDLYPGVSMQFNDIRCRHIGTESTQLPLLELNYCAEGRFECELHPGSYVRLQEGCFSANRLCCRKVTSSFPTGSYRGISFMLDVGAAQGYMDERHPELALRLRDLPQRLCPDNTCFLARADGMLRQIFEQLGDAPSCLGVGFYRIKALELLALLSAWRPGLKPCQKYLTQESVELMRHIRERLGQELDRELTLEQLAGEHGVCVTALKRNFVSLYGVSPAAYRRRCRMDHAARQLTETNIPIMQIAGSVGYLNASKFSAAFRAERGVTPCAFRKNSRANRSIQDGKQRFGVD